MLIGRTEELKILNQVREQEKSSLVVVYGRRRIGKSFLIERHVSQHSCLYFEGIEGQGSKYHIRMLSQQIKSNFKTSELLKKQYDSWEAVMELLTSYIKSRKNKKTIIFFDEYQWIASNRSRLTSIIKKYWDKEWKKMNVQLILCGSISSYMIKKVIKSKALYGRIDLELNIKQLAPKEASLFFSKSKSELEKFKYLLIFGGTPKYLEDINQSLSFEKNLARFFFDKNSGYVNEYEKIFYSQFKEHRVYENIIRLLAKEALTLDQISKKLSFSSGGGLKSYLDNLVKAQFIKDYYASPDKLKSKIITYKIIDPFLKFYMTFVFPHRNLILNAQEPLSLLRRITKNKLNIYLGHALENFSQLFALELAKLMDFEDEVISYGPFLKKSAQAFQIDLLYFRENKCFTICEIKYSDEMISPAVIPEVENKVYQLKQLYPNHSIQKALITIIGPSKALKESRYFDYILSGREILKA